MLDRGHCHSLYTRTMETKNKEIFEKVGNKGIDVITFIDRAWDDMTLFSKDELTPLVVTKDRHKCIIVELRNRKEYHFWLSFEEYNAFRELQANYLGIQAKVIE